MNENENRVNILIKAWETYQNLSKGFSENSWKIRTTGIGFWAATVAYGYKNNDNNIYVFSILIILMFFILEAGMRQLQYKYIDRSIEIEKTINDYLVGDDLILPNEGISTNVSTPTTTDFFLLFRLRRWRFWFPYLILICASVLLFFI
ncbi:hypothetical protein SAMN05877753_101411 [Bacillus oleivorans]|uniref:DUF2270 domain-containing protein n=1 Tax=Bacillus oleivorans TaxID=1448271 RepID=A0A285CJB5_9BACI|nr:hypothetical protein [Bacillus oleivorans]SNX67096.1 hypothetical protein SAMN05877753_101411 [Bacillus oleivorans]